MVAIDTQDGWYPDPTGRSAERLYLSGVWTRRVRDAEGAERTEGDDHTGAIDTVRAPRGRPASAAAGSTPARGWSAERPSYGLATAIVGAVAAVLAFLIFDWAPDSSFGNVRTAVGATGTGASVVTQAYFRVVAVPLLVDVLITGLLVAVGRMVARVAVALAGVLGGVGLIVVVVWIESGGVGSDHTRGDALPVLSVMVGVGVVAAALGVGAYFDESASLARSLAGVLAGLAVVLHVYAIEDAFAHGDSAFGAWLPVIGYGLLAIAPALPYRRIVHA